MSANITNINGKYSFAENQAEGQTAWHNLGTGVQGLMDIKTALEKGGQDFRVAKQPVIVCGKQTDFYATVRMDTQDTMGMVKESYKVIQNDSAFDFFNPVIKNGEAIIESVGTLGKYGEKTFMLAKLPESYLLGGVDEHRTYILLTNDHSGNGTCLALPTDVRVVCWNTLNLAIGSAKKEKIAMVKIRHSGDVKAKLAEAHKVMMVTAQTAKMNEKLNQMFINTKVTQELARKLIDGLLDIKVEFAKDADQINSMVKLNQRDMLIKLFNDGTGSEMFPNTAYNFVNAVTEWVDHKKSVRGGDELSSLFVGGNGFRIKTKAQDLLLNYVK